MFQPFILRMCLSACMGCVCMPKAFSLVAFVALMGNFGEKVMTV